MIYLHSVEHHAWKEPPPSARRWLREIKPVAELVTSVRGADVVGALPVQRLPEYQDATRSGRGVVRGHRSVFPLEVGRLYRLVEPSAGKRTSERVVYVRHDGLETATPEHPAWKMVRAGKVPAGADVLTAARQRVSWAFDTFPTLYLSGPSGKDSSVMMHLVCQEARRRGRKVGVLYVDLEAQYSTTIEHAREMFTLYADVIDPHWVALPFRLRNAVSMEQPYWVCWDPECPDAWVRKPPPEAITDPSAFPFYEPPQHSVEGHAREAMEFEEFIEGFGAWYGGGQACACFVGIRCDESLNRWRAIVKKRKSRLEGKAWTASKGRGVFNVYPIHDWRTEDIWTYVGRERLPYNQIYDWMYKAGLSIHQARICQPYGDDQRRGLNLFQVLEPETWTRVVARVSGANSGALYAAKRGNILGNGKVTLPRGHTWESFAQFLLTSLPEHEAEHYRDKIAVFLKWWEHKGVSPIPDAPNPELAEQYPRKGGPSWYRICKVILRNDRMCRGLSFSQHRSGTHERYSQLMKKRRAQWGLSI